MKKTSGQANVKIKTKVKAGGPLIQHNQSAAGFKTKTKVKSGGPVLQHNQSAALAPRPR
jgi:hypothetical protein